jgi:hypothetical protein
MEMAIAQDLFMFFVLPLFFIVIIIIF